MDAPEQPALELEDVTRTFGSKSAVDDVSLSLEPGAFLGLLGRNGAGKSTLLRLVTGLLAPTYGRVRVLGRDPRGGEAIAVKRLIGVMPEDMGLLDRLTGPQHLSFVGRMYGLDDDVIEARSAELFDKLDLAPEPGTLVCDFSFGMKKKLALSSALIHAPRIVLLDEPFEGIDPLTSRTIKDMLGGLRRAGVTLVLTSHVLEIVERLCPRLAIIDAGRIVGEGSLDELRGGAEDPRDLESLFVELMGGATAGELSWL